MKATEKKSNVLFSPKKLNLAKKNLELKTAEVELPELNEIMGLGDGETAIMIVRQLEFSELVKVKTSVMDYARNLVDGIVESVSDKAKVKESVAEIWGEMSPDTRERLDMVEIALVEPKMSRADIIYLSKMFPVAITKLYTKIVELTSGGATLKKSSSG